MDLPDVDPTFARDLDLEPPRPKWKCRGCAYTSNDRWTGPCPGCFGTWNILKNAKDKDESRTSLAAVLNAKPRMRFSTGIPEFDRVLGGSEATGYGIVEGEAILIGGPRGGGKSTLLLQAADGVTKAKGGGRVLYASGEQNRDDIIDMAARLGIANDKIDVIGNESDVYKIVSEAEDKKPRLLVIDSVQVMYMDDVDADVGQVAQIDAVANYLTSFGKSEKVAILMVCHLTKQAEYAGSAKLQHLVDALIRIDPAPLVGEDGTIVDGTELVRELWIDGKNRFGSEATREKLEMTPEGLKPLSARVRKLISVLEF